MMLCIIDNCATTCIYKTFFDVTTDDNLTMILHEFLPFIEIKQVPSSSANYDLEAF